MATRTFSGRVDENALAFADALARRDYGLSFGQYCGTILLDSIQATGAMPSLPSPSPNRGDAASFIKGFAARACHPEIGRMSDAEVRDMIAGRYE